MINKLVFRPMLAADCHGDLSEIPYPCLVTPKFDGVRCLTMNQVCAPGALSVPVSRSLKPIPNLHIAALIGMLPPGLDGEIITYTDGKMDTFHHIQGKVMSVSGAPTFTYHVFDTHDDRLARHDERLKRVVPRLGGSTHAKFVIPTIISDQATLEKFVDQCLLDGYEGAIARRPAGPYKHGRSTVREGWMIKIKRFEDAEARIIGFQELMHNDNDPTIDVRGHQVRASHQNKMRHGQTLGALFCEDMKDRSIQFNIGSGFTQADRDTIWKNQQTFMRKIVKYKHQPHGRKTDPRSPIFLGFRDPDDMDDPNIAKGQGELI